MAIRKARGNGMCFGSVSWKKVVEVVFLLGEEIEALAWLPPSPHYILGTSY
jgi:hypothetical protein